MLQLYRMQSVIAEYLDCLKFFGYAPQLFYAMVQGPTYLCGGLFFHIFLAYMDVLLSDHTMPELHCILKLYRDFSPYLKSVCDLWHLEHILKTSEMLHGTPSKLQQLHSESRIEQKKCLES